MCGICGIIQSEPAPLAHDLRAMNEAQAHRGPDGEGFYVDGDQPVLQSSFDERLAVPGWCGLGHRRLAILDPARGAQPMQDRSGRYTVLLNGEIYNFQRLRDRLQQAGRTFHTDTDTEVLLYLFAESPESPERWLRELNGIFALAVWDREARRLLLARDHFGVKPLHVAQQEDRLLFASEIKSILAAGHPARLNRDALHAFMNVRFLPGHDTLFRGVQRLPPGHFAWVRDSRLEDPVCYYRLPEAGGDMETDRGEVQRQVHDAFYEAVQRQLLSDVPLGMALSGGLDSSMIVAAASHLYADRPGLRLADRELRTFTLGFNEPTDENDDARIVAEHFQTSHHETRLQADPLRGAREVIRAVEEPKINMIQGYELARFVQPHVKVLFSGLGGDELFAGYDIHRYGNTLGRLNRWVPRGVQRTLLGPLGRGLGRLVYGLGVLKWEYPRIGAQIALSAGDGAQFYARLRNAWDYDPFMYGRVYADPDAFRACRPVASSFEPFFQGQGSYLDRMLRAEFQTKMVNDFLVNEDRVTSAHGVEGRVPFLDRDFVELGFRIPAAMKMAGSETKALWKESVGEVLPKQILGKTKQGFTFSSYHQWEKDLRDTVRRELSETWCREAGLFNHRFVQDLLDYPAHPNLRWHYFMAWMMLGVKEWMDVFDVSLD